MHIVSRFARRQSAVRTAAMQWPGHRTSRFSRRTAQLTAIAAISAAFAAAQAFGQSAYPVRPIRLVVPFPPGASNDTIGRAIAEKMHEAFGQPVVVDNRGGAGTTIGTHIVAKSPPDGYTLMFTSVSYATNAAVQPKLPFDPLADITGITMIGMAPMLLVAHPGVPAKTAKEFIALARSQPGQLNYASNGIGTVPHLLIEILMREAKLSLVHVPYKGLGAALTDLVAGQVHVLIASPPSVYPHVRAGKLRALAVSTAKRSAFAPELPTISESGVPGYTAQQWWGMFAPAGTPNAIVSSIHAQVAKILAADDIKRRLSAQGAEPAPMSPSDFNSFVGREIAMWTKVVKERGIRPE
ncbi:MAG: tripartite tricarboxylate transporter substrate binding protein [Betaproteobacteria bacterium]|nr:MAG: tripartite tricarboxylate transporter substrate binding protein [Betaproteobacteria bacterium]